MSVTMALRVSLLMSSDTKPRSRAGCCSCDGDEKSAGFFFLVWLCLWPGLLGWGDFC